MQNSLTPGARATLLGTGSLVALLIASFSAQRNLGQGFLPHGYCFTWIPALLWLNVISDVLIATAYLSIPLTLAYFVQRRVDLPFSWVFVLFGIFIVACGATHALDVWTVWHADYWLLGGVKAITAAASVPTAVALVWLMPKMLSIPSAHQLHEVNDALRNEIAARVIVEKRLEASRGDLQKLVRREDERAENDVSLARFFLRQLPGLPGSVRQQVAFRQSQPCIRSLDRAACRTPLGSKLCRGGSEGGSVDPGGAERGARPEVARTSNRVRDIDRLRRRQMVRQPLCRTKNRNRPADWILCAGRAMKRTSGRP